MEAITLPIYNTEGKEIDTVELNSSVFDGNVNTAAIYQAVNAYRANQRKGLASTKTRGEVSGGGRKPWRQKGTGRARVGSIRSPLWRHGGVIFGPHPRVFYYKLPNKIKLLALKSCLNAKVKENNFIVLDSLKLEKPKTKEANKIFSMVQESIKHFPIPLQKSPKVIAEGDFLDLKVVSQKDNKPAPTLLLLDKLDENLKRALRNIGFLNVNLAKDTHAYEVLAHRKVIITKEGLKGIIHRFKK